MLISFVGALPLGSLNITAFDIAANDGFTSAIGFALAAIVVELIYVRLTLLGNRKLVVGDRFARYALPFAAALLLYLAIASFYTAKVSVDVPIGPMLFPKIASPILLGLLLSALNPLQIPFWMLWNKYLLDKGILVHQRSSYAGYMMGIGSGTFLGLLVFMFLGRFIVSNYEGYHEVTNTILGILYLGFSCYLLILLYKKRTNLKTP
ncbi:LysE family transporter [Flagellimonas sp. DF-77]|uniref:LysE family transporter n=1 Tax=Flagellimonas algarum TaxID=3230298 RepID=UPI003398FD6D